MSVIEAEVDRCSDPDCSGVAIVQFRCLEHAHDHELDEALDRLIGDEPIDVRDTRISGERLQRLLAPYAMPNGRRVVSAVDFRGVEFTGHAKFDGVTFNETARFRDARFLGDTGFTEALFLKDADFSDALFERSRKLGPLVVRERLLLDEALFAERITIDAVAEVLSARGAKFAAGVHLRVRKAEIGLDDVDFARASTITGVTPAWPGESLPDGRLPGTPKEVDQPRLITLRGSQVGTVSLSNVDLRACRYLGAHGLASLRIESSCRWPTTPETWWFVDRETIAEEHVWRSRHGQRSHDWNNRSTGPPAWLEERDGRSVIGARQIASIYRALRKAREDEKDEPGAIDLYYGEMEMRRLGPREENGTRVDPRARVDHAILATYWLLAGYGLKAGRALFTLVALILMMSFGLQTWGFESDPRYVRALLHSVESTSSLLRTPATAGLEATYAGEVMQIVLRLLGPILLGLAFLAVRARVKR